MGPITLPRMRSVRREEVLTPRSSLPVVQEGDTRDKVPGLREPASRAIRLHAAFIAPLLMPLASAATRHWLVEAGATLCVAGGFIAAPFLTLTAWIGLALPRRMLLHQASTALFLVAILWMAAALIGAHLHHHRQPAHAAGRSDERE